MTIVVDTSALIAMLFEEGDAEMFRAAINAHRGDMLIAAPTLLETMMVLEGKGYDARAILPPIIVAAGMTVAPFSSDLAEFAHAAFLRFGKGRHPAKLNFGDCMAYALAWSIGAPLLFKGGDFALTDIVPAL